MSKYFKFPRVLALFYAVAVASGTGMASKVYNIHWNASNPIFRIDKTDNVIDVNAGNHPSEYDQVNIVCPVYKANLDEDRQERYIIYLVSKEEFKSCRITQPNPRVIAVCNRPYDFMYFTITFRSFTPTPGGLEFHPGQDYYFISTSTSRDLHRRVGGSCSSNNMKLIFKVADGDQKNREDKDDEKVLSTNEEAEPKEVKMRYHPWRLPSAASKQKTEVVATKPKPEESTVTETASRTTSSSTTSTFYYPMQELERANELLESRKRSKNVNFNIYRGARKAFGARGSDLTDVEVEISSGVSGPSPSPTSLAAKLFIAVAVCSSKFILS